jgi:Protein of unknown function (DUF4238)
LASHKNQHYVPQCALTPFSLNGEGHAINLLNIPSSKAVENASLKKQCSRNYFYGKEDLTLETQLGQLEGEYARIVAALAADKSLSSADREWLYIFIIVQMHRTERAVQRLRDFINDMADAVFHSHPEQRPEPLSTIELVMMSMDVGLKELHRIVDLKIVILRNKTNIEFIISDHPVAMTNKYHFEKLNKQDFGLASSGVLIYLPLTPNLTALLYDTGVYSIPNASGTPFIDLRHDHDVTSLNNLQHINADKNVYFKNWSDRERIAIEIRELPAQGRGIERSVTTFVKDADLPNETRWRRGSTEEEQAARQALILSSVNYPRPPDFPLFIKYRNKPKTFSDGSAAGFVRKSAWRTLKRPLGSFHDAFRRTAARS